MSKHNEHKHSEHSDAVKKNEHGHHGALPPIVIPTVKGPYQDNGASPWYAAAQVGTQSNLLPLKVALDSGSHFNWVTSTQCNTPACTLPTRVRFDASKSSTFRWIDPTVITEDWGPWGKMQVNLGSDLVYLGTQGDDLIGSNSNLWLSVNYDGEQFIELNWDGGMCFPTGLDGDASDPNMISYVQMLLNSGFITPDQAMVSFNYNPQSRQGTCIIGGYNPNEIDPASKITVPFTPYTPGGQTGIRYVWTTPLDSWRIGPVEVAKNQVFCHDTGSSQIKGDSTLMLRAANTVYELQHGSGVYPNQELVLGVDQSGKPGRFVLTPDMYVSTIEAGAGKGQKTININPLAGLPNLVLAGSIFLDQVYTIYRYKVSGSPGNYSLAPDDVWMFNKKNGPKVIQN